MSRIKVMVNGIPGNMAVNVARHILADDRFALVPFSLTGPEIEAAEHKIESIAIRLLKPEESEQAIDDLKQKEGEFLSVDYTHPSAVNANAEFYCKYQLPDARQTCDAENPGSSSSCDDGNHPYLSGQTSVLTAPAAPEDPCPIWKPAICLDKPFS